MYSSLQSWQWGECRYNCVEIEPLILIQSGDCLRICLHCTHFVVIGRVQCSASVPGTLTVLADAAIVAERDQLWFW